ncbi:MAG TPA: response regulator [Myxococcales bacterium]|jgi:CheY-like chemotaxis protein|nr:response regulator [Myxococcales bacterium]
MDRQVSGARLLLVENERDLQEVMVELLEADGFRAITTDSVPGALQMLAAQTFQLVLTDFQLGGELAPWAELQRIRDAAHPAPVGIVTGAAIDPQEAQRRGFAFAIQKPFEWEALLACVMEHVRPQPPPIG